MWGAELTTCNFVKHHWNPSENLLVPHIIMTCHTSKKNLDYIIVAKIVIILWYRDMGILLTKAEIFSNVVKENLPRKKTLH